MYCNYVLLQSANPKQIIRMQRFGSSIGNIEKDRADLGSQKLLSKLTTISLQTNIQKIMQIRNSLAPLFSIQKSNVGSSQ